PVCRFSHSTRNFTRNERCFHNIRTDAGVPSAAMRQAFVLHLGSETETARRHFEGCIEEVDTGHELRFRSTDELLEFLGKCFDERLRNGREPDEEEGEAGE